MVDILQIVETILSTIIYDHFSHREHRQYHQLLTRFPSICPMLYKAGDTDNMEEGKLLKSSIELKKTLILGRVHDKNEAV